MTPTDPFDRRRALALLAWAALLPGAAWADDGDSGPGGEDDDRDDSDDDSDDGDDDGGRDDENRDRDDEGRHGDDDGDEGDGDGAPGLRDITVLYPDGWVERIRGGLYELIDPRGRRVVARSATVADFARMIALR